MGILSSPSEALRRTLTESSARWGDLLSTSARGTLREVSDGAEARPITTSVIVRLAAAIVILSALALYLAYIHGTALVDDAYITLIYARSLAEGTGLTFTEGARVEGYTDFLWVLLGAGAIKAGAAVEVHPD
jgi:hypothetical protein